MNFAVLASGSGTNLQAIIRACRQKRIRAELKVVFSDRPNAFALERARKARVPCVAYRSPRLHPSRASFDKAVVKLLKDEGVDFVVLAGYMRILSPVFIRAFKDRILNIHPALLPAFKGAQAIHDALEYGARVTGVTVHIVDEEVDHGPIVAQAALEIRPTDTPASLEARIHKVEHRIYPQVIDLFARGRLRVVGRVVKVV